MRWIQADSESATIHDVKFNSASIREKTVVLADIGGCPVGFCQAVTGRSLSDPLFVQMIAVVPAARRRGVGLALLAAVASSEPARDIVMATLDGNVAARALNEGFARSLGLAIRRVPIRSYRRSEMGFGPGEKHRPWLIARA
ncbi:GNAT family N-acetyltransferase [Microbacterium sp. CFBP 13617]|uniref:GNAT family N-acetyltransferase n=1 Tax=Microbacterium sp. CFBP 13617 TaxID=2774035 RepID=UPI00406CF2F0